jgi:hypothetical protein
MWRRIELFRYRLGLLTLAALVLCGLSCRNAKISYRLSREGYSPSTNTLLFAVSYKRPESLKAYGLPGNVSWLATYNEEKRSVKHLLYPSGPGPSDFAWAPGQAIFAVTHGDRMTLFQKDPTSDRGYSGTAIRCPVDVSSCFAHGTPRAGGWL